MQGLGKAPKWRASPGASFPLPFLTSWAITRCRGRFSFQDISDYELVIKAVYLSWHARFVGHSPPSMIQIRINDSQTLGSWHIKGTDESLPRVSLLIPFMYHDPESPLAACQSDYFWSFISRGATIIALTAIFGYFSQTDSTADFLFVRNTYHSL